MNTINKKIILASGSPRRKELLESLGLDFEVVVLSIDETMKDNVSLNESISDLAYRKADAVFKDNQDSLVIGSDTIVVFDTEILGKPKDKEDARQILSKLSGKVHEVKTAVAILTSNQYEVFVSTTKVKMSQITDEEIETYIETGEPMDKAGAYGIQGYGARFIESIEGDYYTVMGLPINMLYQNLKRFL